MSVFKFKKFSVRQDLAAAKVGTDGVLLGAWIQLNHNPESILDIGSGTGLLALMMAQKFESSSIAAIEIEDLAYQESLHNFEMSPWSDRLTSNHISLSDYKSENTYDLIISNPPFYIEDTLSNNIRRGMARNNKFMPIDLLIQRSAIFLKPNGILAIIIPYTIEDILRDIAEENHLYINALCRVRGNSKSPIKRSLVTLGRNKATQKMSNLTIEKERHIYTDDYINLTRDFYLNM